MSRGFNSAIPSPAAAAMFSHSQPVSSAMSNTSISKVYYKRQLFRKTQIPTDVLHLWLHTRLLGFFLNTQIKMRVNVRYCTCASARDTGPVLKRLSGASDPVTIQTRRKRLCMRRLYISHWGCLRSDCYCKELVKESRIDGRVRKKVNEFILWTH